jgi:FkbM family methyltransferase
VLRRLAEYWTRDVVVKRTLPLDVGAATIYVSPDAQLKYLKRNLAQVEHSLLDQARALIRPATNVWDLGANVGVFAFAASGLAGSAGRVLAIEADPWLFSLLQRSRAAATIKGATSSAPITLLCAAVSETSGLAHFSIAARGRASNALQGFGNSQTGGIREEVIIGQVTMDDILEDTFSPDVVKIDIEGAELVALLAAPKLLAARPIILVEVADRNATALANLFWSADYELFDAAKPLDRIRPVGTCVWDTLAVPAEKRPSLDLRIGE